LYRIKFKRDIFRDIAKLEKNFAEKGSEEMSLMEIDDLEIFENVAYIMAWHADPSIPGNIDEWLENFEMFSIYEVLPEILELWGDNLMTQVDSKKNRQKAVAK
jgi:flavorubredoxin